MIFEETRFGHLRMRLAGVVGLGLLWSGGVFVSTLQPAFAQRIDALNRVGFNAELAEEQQFQIPTNGQ